MRLSTAIKRLTKEYDAAVLKKSVRKPLSYALYHTWKWADTYEKERGNASDIQDQTGKSK